MSDEIEELLCCIQVEVSLLAFPLSFVLVTAENNSFLPLMMTNWPLLPHHQYSSSAFLVPVVEHFGLDEVSLCSALHHHLPVV